jgi:hypothetical protein
MKNHRSETDELQVCAEMRAFARLLMPLYQAEYERQLMSSAPSWLFMTILERRLRELEQAAR